MGNLQKNWAGVLEQWSIGILEKEYRRQETEVSRETQNEEP
jgi:hypothetical protein